MNRWAYLSCAVVIGGALLVWASEEDADYRHYAMEAKGGHFQAIVKIVRKEVDHEEHLAVHVDALAGLADMTDTLFPEGSEGGEALASIWENPEDFAEKVEAFKVAVGELKDTVASGDGESIGKAVFKVGGTCKGCHDDYRE